MSKLTTTPNTGKSLRADGKGRDLESQSYCVKPRAFKREVVGISKKAALALSFLLALGLSYKVYDSVKLMQTQIADLSHKSQSLERALTQKEKIIASQGEVISKLGEENKSGAAVAPVQVINNINVPSLVQAAEKKSARNPASAQFETIWDNYIETDSFIRPKLPKRQLPLSSYVDEVNPALAKDYADLLLQIRVQKNRFQRHQRADWNTYREHNRINGNDRLAFDRFSERQQAQDNELDRIFDKVQDSYKEQSRLRNRRVASSRVYK